MKPWFHFNSYFLGIIVSIMYQTYLFDRSVEDPVDVSYTSRILKRITLSRAARYTGYVVGFAIMLLAFFGMYPYISDKSNWSQTTFVLYNAFGYQAFIIGMCLIMVPALIGKAQFVRYFFGGQFWLFFSQFSLGYYYFVPLLALIVFCGVAHSVFVEWQIMFYYYVGNVIYATMFGAIFMIIVDRPMYTVFRIHDYSKLAVQDFDISTVMEDDKQSEI